ECPHAPSSKIGKPNCSVPVFGQGNNRRIRPLGAIPGRRAASRSFRAILTNPKDSARRPQDALARATRHSSIHLRRAITSSGHPVGPFAGDPPTPTPARSILSTWALAPGLVLACAAASPVHL